MVSVFFDTDPALLFATANMAVALMLGAIIGSERQFRGRMAGLRTNALVSLGAAGFVIFAALFPDDINPTRVAAQVVSGIGFLGAGIIFRDGFNIQGINTAATLWCSAAVGLIAGTGHIFYAVALTSLIVFANLGLRPVVRRLKNAAANSAVTEQLFELVIECRHEDEKAARTIMIDALVEQHLEIREIVSRADEKFVELLAHVYAPDSESAKIEKAISKISLAPRLRRVSWGIAEDGD